MLGFFFFLILVSLIFGVIFMVLKRVWLNCCVSEVIWC
jgi:hypothetical protein